RFEGRAESPDCLRAAAGCRADRHQGPDGAGLRQGRFAIQADRRDFRRFDGFLSDSRQRKGCRQSANAGQADQQGLFGAAGCGGNDQVLRRLSSAHSQHSSAGTTVTAHRAGHILPGSAALGWSLRALSGELSCGKAAPRRLRSTKSPAISIHRNAMDALARYWRPLPALLAVCGLLQSPVYPWAPNACADPDVAAHDSDDSNLILLAPAHPVFIQFRVRVDGRGLKAVRAVYAGKLFGQYDRDGDKLLDRDEASAMPPLVKSANASETVSIADRWEAVDRDPADDKVSLDE